MLKPTLTDNLGKTPLIILAVITSVILFCEVALTLIMKNFNLPIFSAIILNSFLTIVAMMPVMYFFVYKPLKAETEQSKYMRLKVEESHNVLLKILDSIDAIVYVSDIQTYEILFLNKYAKEIFGDVVGSLCWKTLQNNESGPCEFCSNKYLLGVNGTTKGMYNWEIKNTINGHWYDMRDRAIRWIDDRIVRLEVAIDITDKKKAEEEREKLIEKLKNALDEVNTLRGIIPICASCKKVRDDQGYWKQIESYIKDHSEADFSHGICPDCAREHYPKFYAKK